MGEHKNIDQMKDMSIISPGSEAGRDLSDNYQNQEQVIIKFFLIHTKQCKGITEGFKRVKRNRTH